MCKKFHVKKFRVKKDIRKIFFFRNVNLQLLIKMTVEAKMEYFFIMTERIDAVFLGGSKLL